MLFANGSKRLRLNRDRFALEVVTVPEGNVEGLDIFVHDETNKPMAQLLVDIPFGSPLAARVIYCNPAGAARIGVAPACVACADRRPQIPF